MLIKAEEQTLNMINITKRKLMTLANGAECLSTKVDIWVTSNNNYRKLRSSRLSKSCQTMTDHPTSYNSSSYWSYEDTRLLENWMAEKPEGDSSEGIKYDIIPDDQRSSFQEISEINNLCYDSLDKNILIKNNSKSIIQPVIKMDEDFIEVEYYCDVQATDNDADYSITDNLHNLYICNDGYNDDISHKLQKSSQELPKKMINRRMENQEGTPKIPSYKIANNKGLSPRRSPKYSEFLVKQEDNNNLPNYNNDPLKIDKNERNNKNNLNLKNSSDEKNVEFDDHRPLAQIASDCNEHKNGLSRQERSIMYERGGSARIKSLNGDFKSEIKSFLSFRCPNKKNKSDKKIRKKYVTSEEGVVGPIWPAVLLTYDRSISPGPHSNNPDE